MHQLAGEERSTGCKLTTNSTLNTHTMQFTRHGPPNQYYESLRNTASTGESAAVELLFLFPALDTKGACRRSDSGTGLQPQVVTAQIPQS